MDLKFPFYQRLLAIGLVRVQRPDGTIWWVGRRAAEEMASLGEATVIQLTAEQAKEMDEAE